MKGLGGAGCVGTEEDTLAAALASGRSASRATIKDCTFTGNSARSTGTAPVAKTFLPSEQEAATLLGWTEVSWDSATGTARQPAVMDKDWTELSTKEQAAARALGFTQTTWDNASGEEPEPAVRDKDWSELSGPSISDMLIGSGGALMVDAGTVQSENNQFKNNTCSGTHVRHGTGTALLRAAWGEEMGQAIEHSSCECVTCAPCRRHSAVRS